MSRTDPGEDGATPSADAPAHAAAARAVVLEGRGGLLDGVRVPLRPRMPVVVGRSRSCDLSFRKAPGFVRRVDRERLLRSREFNRLSRIHCELTLQSDGRIEIRDLSHNGTWVEGDRVRGAVVVDLRHGAVHVDPLEGEFGSLLIRSDAS